MVLKFYSLIGIGPLCDAGFKVLSTNQEVIVTNNEQVVWKLWCGNCGVVGGTNCGYYHYKNKHMFPTQHTKRQQWQN